MNKTYYNPEDLKKFGDISQWNEELGKKFFDYYGKVFEDGALSAREKSLIALAVSHVVKCPYCIEAYTKDGLQRGITKEEMMEAVHAGAAIESGATLVHGVQMMNKVKSIYLSKTKLEYLQLEDILKHDLWLDANTCKKYGLIDEII